MRRGLAFLAAAGIVLGGCTGGDAQVSKADEEKFKNPGKVDMSKIPSNPMPAGTKSYVGEPSGGSGPQGGSGAPAPAGR